MRGRTPQNLTKISDIERTDEPNEDFRLKELIYVQQKEQIL
jgi:hypothetical protein